MLILVGSIFGLMVVPTLILLVPFLVWLLAPLAVLVARAYVVSAVRARRVPVPSSRLHPR